MATYCFRREDGQVVERQFSMKKRPDRIVCEDGVPATYDMTATLDGAAVLSGGMGCEFVGGDIASRSLGVNPKQIAAQQAKFPHHRFDSTGRLLYRSRSELNRVLSDTRNADYN